MISIDPKLLATAFVNPATPSLAEVLAHVQASPDLSPTRRRDLASGLRRVARAIGSPIEEAPADPIWLRPRIARVAPAAIRLSEKSWVNAVSDARAAMVHFGIVERRQAPRLRLTPEWQNLWDQLLALGEPSLEQGLGRFLRFLSQLDVAPGAVSDEHAAAFHEALKMNEIRKSPEKAFRSAVCAWNRAAGTLPSWPQLKLTKPSSDVRYSRPLDTFPRSFADDLDRYVDTMAHPDPLDPEARIAPLRTATVAHRRAQVVRFASVLVHAGVAPETITNLSVLVAIPNARRGLTWLLERNGGVSKAGIAELAVMLAQLARSHVRPPKEAQDELDQLARRLAVPRSPGLTPKNRERLRPLQDKATVRELVCLPERLAEKASRDSNLRRAALDMEMAVAIAILLTAPIRRKNLAELHLEHNLRRMRHGRACLVYEAAEVKNRRPLEIELPKSTIALIDRHLRDHRPHLVSPGSPFLFPRRDGQAPIEPSNLSRRISQVIRRELGLEMHLHLFRHFAALLWLQANPGGYEVARRLLGHAELSSTLNAYAGFEAGTATRLFAELVEVAGRGER